MFLLNILIYQYWKQGFPIYTRMRARTRTHIHARTHMYTHTHTHSFHVLYINL